MLAQFVNNVRLNWKTVIVILYFTVQLLKPHATDFALKYGILNY